MRNILFKIINLKRIVKQLIMVLFDSFAIVLALLCSFALRLGYWYFPNGDLFWLIMMSPFIAVPIFYRFGLYQSIIRYQEINAFWSVAKAASLYAISYGVIVFLTSIYGTPRSVILINWVLVLVFLFGSRFFARWILIDAHETKNSIKKIVVLIYGAGSAGRQLLLSLKHSDEYSPMAFIDDQKELQGKIINGVKVYSSKNIHELIKNNLVNEIFIAIPSISKVQRKSILDYLEPFPVLVKSLPGVAEIAQGNIKIEDFKEININDLLGRDSISANTKLLKQNISNKIVLVTGAGGSIGCELCRQILLLKPKVLILFEINESALYEINSEMLDIGNSKVKIIPILGSVLNKKRTLQVFRFFNVQTIYHSAAYKHVPMVEFNNIEGINNNIFGTLNCAQTAIDCGVETFVLISTDKAVRPTNTMGTTKRVSEMILQALSKKQSITRFTMVRFGNVLGSSGSVIPLFSKQIKSGGPVTVTSKKMIRYFMTIPEAVELVIQAGAMASGGDVYVLDMGEPMLINDLAKKMIHLSGLEIKDKNNLNGDIEIEYIGIRPGEKLFEELIIGKNVTSTNNPMIMRAEELMLDWIILNSLLSQLEKAIENEDYQKIRNILITIVPEFKPQSSISDLLYDSQK